MQELVTCRGCGAEHFAYEAKCPITGRVVGDGPVGTLVGPYRVGKLIGMGGFGTVHVADDTRDSSKVALKLLHASLVRDPSIVERFAREAEATARAGNPHIVRVLDASFTNQCVYVALELLRGVTVASALRSGPMPVTEAVDIAIQALDGLAVAHDMGVIHRDIKPGNIFLAEENGVPRSCVKLLDFGIGRMLEDDKDARLTRTGMQLGTPHFTAPEQVLDAKRATERADLYSIAATLFMMISGERPYGNISPAEWLIQMANHTPVRRVQSPFGVVSKELADAVAIGLSIEPAQRFQSARAFARALLDSTPDAPSATRVLQTVDQDPSVPPPQPPEPVHDMERAQAPTRALATVDPGPSPANAPVMAPAPLVFAPSAPAYAQTFSPTSSQAGSLSTARVLLIVGTIALFLFMLLAAGGYAVYQYFRPGPGTVPALAVSPSVLRCLSTTSQYRLCAEYNPAPDTCTPGDFVVSACPTAQSPSMTCTYRTDVSSIRQSYDHYASDIGSTLARSCLAAGGHLEVQ